MQLASMSKQRNSMMHSLSKNQQQKAMSMKKELKGSSGLKRSIFISSQFINTF